MPIVRLEPILKDALVVSGGLRRYAYQWPSRSQFKAVSYQ